MNTLINQQHSLTTNGSKNSLFSTIILLASFILFTGTHLGNSVSAHLKMPSTDKPRPLSLRLIPENPSLWGANSTQHFLVLAKYTDGMERDVTNRSHFSLSNTTIATINNSGRLTAQENGNITLSCEFTSLSASTKITIKGILESRPFSFARDIGTVLTKQGCNNSECHGGVKGQGGLKLSVNALFPKEDFRWIIKGGTYQVMSAAAAGNEVSRINLKEPETSLLLVKPTLTVPHGGGKQLNVNSSGYQTILEWIQNGAPYGEEEAIKGVYIERLEVFPQEVVLDQSGQHGLIVTAHLSNGRQEDITDQVLYESNDEQIIEVIGSGQVKAHAVGESSVMIRAAGQAASARFGVIAKPLLHYPIITQRNFIDRHVFKKLKDFNIIPSSLSADTEFLRRICLDVTGKLPPPERIREFLLDQDPKKRDALIEVLLNSTEYIEYWTYFFSELFRVKPTALNEHALLRQEWVRNNIAQNIPYDRVARERIAAQGFNAPSWHYWTNNKITPVPAITTEQIRVFLGRRLGCAQCHNHPYENWSQDQFWGLAAFFGDMTQLMAVAPSKLRGPYFFIDDLDGNGSRKDQNPAKLLHPRTKKHVAPQFPDGRLLPDHERIDLRMRLAEWMTSPNNPFFSEAIVNRIWAHFFGRGIVEPVDDFRSTNPPTHPRLLKELSKTFVTRGYDIKHLIRTILQSRTYQLSGKANNTNKDDRVNYSRALPRLLEAAPLLDAISQATGIDSELIASREGNASTGAPPGTRSINLFPGFANSHFLEVYNRNDRRGVPENKPQLTLLQSLHRLAGPTFTTRLLKQKESHLNQLLKQHSSDIKIIEELYLLTVSRFPTNREVKGLKKMIKAEPSRQKGFQSLIWALVSSREFVYNH